DPLIPSAFIAIVRVAPDRVKIGASRAPIKAVAARESLSAADAAAADPARAMPLPVRGNRGEAVRRGLGWFSLRPCCPDPAPDSRRQQAAQAAACRTASGP